MKHVSWAISAGLVAVAGQAAAAEQVVTMQGGVYAPAVLEAKVGDTIRFLNDDDDWHEVFVPTVGFALDLGKQDPGAEAMLTLAQAGEFEVECVHHPDMLLSVRVAP